MSVYTERMKENLRIILEGYHVLIKSCEQLAVNCTKLADMYEDRAKELKESAENDVNFERNFKTLEAHRKKHLLACEHYRRTVKEARRERKGTIRQYKKLFQEIQNESEERNAG